MNLRTAAYSQQLALWPKSGRHILAQFDADSVVVYQAFRPSIARFAVEHGHFGGDFSLARMSWIKTNFLWMMYRCGWASKTDQECVLAVTISREVFDRFLGLAVASSFHSDRYASSQAWREALAGSNIRLQWDPDHTPSGVPTVRRAIQIGLRGEPLREYAQDAIRKIEDITDFVHSQRHAAEYHLWDELMLPEETIYPITSEIAFNLSVNSLD